MARQRDLDAEVREWVSTRVAEILASSDLDRIIRLVDDAISAEVPEVGQDPALRAALDASTEGALRLYLTRVPYDVPGSTDATPEMQALGRSLARRGSDVSVLLRVYRVGQRTLWQDLMDQVTGDELDRDLQAAVLRFLWEHVSRTLEHVVEDVVAAYVGEAEQRLRGTFARRAETIGAMLRGDDVDVDVATTATKHKVGRQQTALVLWGPDEMQEQALALRLEQIARSIAETVGAGTPLTVPSGSRTLWAWLATGPGAPLDAIPRARELVNAPDVRLAVGEPAPGVAGFRSSHLEALRAQAVATASDRPPQVTRFREVEAVALLATDEPAMRRFVARSLSGLAATDAATGRLRDTVLAYLAGGSSARAAKALTVHKNTVLYRLQQAEQLLGHPVDESSFEVEAALRLAATYGDGVLQD